MNKYVYQCKLTLQDHTGNQLNAYLCDDEAEKFFYNLPPMDFTLLSNRKSRSEVEKRLGKLTKKEVWIDVCLFSYIPLQDKENEPVTNEEGNGKKRKRMNEEEEEEEEKEEKEGEEVRYHSSENVRYQIFGTTIL